MPTIPRFVPFHRLDPSTIESTPALCNVYDIPPVPSFRAQAISAPKPLLTLVNLWRTVERNVKLPLMKSCDSNLGAVSATSACADLIHVLTSHPSHIGLVHCFYFYVHACTALILT